MLKNTRQLTEFITAKLKEKFKQLEWHIYPQIDDISTLKLPSCNIELQSFEIADKLTTDKKTVECTFTARLLFNSTPESQLNIRDAALAISSFLHRNYIGTEQIQDIYVMSNQQDYMSPDVSEVTAWEVLFMLKFHHGDSVYEENGISPNFVIDSVENVV
jgi:hypothetical protein